MGGDKDINFMNSESKGLKGIWAWEESYSWGGNVFSICLKKKHQNLSKNCYITR